jgi:hypothetical protein
MTAKTKLKKLRYELRCSIGELPEAPSATGPMGWTDDLEVACWHASYSPYPGWDVYDHQEGKWAGGAEPPLEMQVRMEVERLLLSLSERWWIVYPYLPPHDEAGARFRDLKVAEHERLFPNWRPAPENVLAPLRVAWYAARMTERAAREADPPAQLAIYPDGRDLELDWVPEMKALRRDLYFKTLEEANKGLSFEPKDGAVWHEMKAEYDRSEPEHLNEWERWRYVHSVRLRREARERGEKMPPLQGRRSLG